MSPAGFSEEYKQQIRDKAYIYKKTESRDLTEFETRVNMAAGELCLNDISLINRRGDLLEKARKRVADEGYNFKKGFSRSKVYGRIETSSTAKRPKYEKEMRDERMKSIEEELQDITRLMQFKEKRLTQAESSKSYKLCEQVTEEIMNLKSKKNELMTEKRLFERKKTRAAKRIRKKGSTVDKGPSSCTSSPQPRSDTSDRSRLKSSSSTSSSQSQLDTASIDYSSSESRMLVSQGTQDDPIEFESLVLILSHHLPTTVVTIHIFGNALPQFIFYKCGRAH